MDETVFFSALTKYASRPLRDPRENRLTEAFAAVLSAVDYRLTKELLQAWLNPEKVDSVWGERKGWTNEVAQAAVAQADSFRVYTQQPFRGRFVDLEFQFAGELKQLVRIEVKHGTKPSNGQVRAYEERDSEGHPRVPVVILAPASDLPFTDHEEAPASAFQRSWEGATRTIREFMDANDLSDVDRWLLNELYKFLDEEGLAPMDRMLKEDAEALARSKRADAALRRVQDVALRVISARWGDVTVQSGGLGVGSWRQYSHGPRGAGEWSLPDDTWLEFKVSSESISPKITGDVVFIAGLSWKSRVVSGLEEALVAPLVEAKFAEFSEGSCARLMRAALPEHFLLEDMDGEATVESQGLKLGEWVVDAFEAIHREVAAGTLVRRP